MCVRVEGVGSVPYSVAVRGATQDTDTLYRCCPAPQTPTHTHTPPPQPHPIPPHPWQGLDEPFLEQWHQKIHQASSPEDVIIAEAYLAFLHTASHDEWWRVLGEHGVTQERLESWEQPITGGAPHRAVDWVLDWCLSQAAG